MRLNNADSFRVVFHEYSHLLLRRTFPNPPLWFNEGLAKYYSTLRVGGSRSAVIGTPVPAHVRLLRQRFMPLAKLFAATEDSPEYTDATANRLVVYAQAWAVVHHAFHGQPKRADQLTALAVTLAAGGDIEESVRSVYGVPLSDVERELRAYVLQDSYQAVAFNFREDFVTRRTREPGLISDAEAEAWLGDLLAQMGRDGEARLRLRLESALKQDPGLARAQVVLERLLRRQNPTSRGFKGLNTVAPLAPGTRPFLRITLADERRSFGLLEALECRGELVEFVLQTVEGTVRARTRFGDVRVINYRHALGDVLCGPQTPPLPTVITWKPAAGEVATAIAVEFVPDEFVPSRNLRIDESTN